MIKYAGISRVNNEQIDLARSIIGSGLVAVQNQFSPSHPDPEHTMKHCAELGLAFVCWSPLGGFLDTFDQSAYDPFRTVAAQRGCSYQRVVLAWELTRYERLFTHSPALAIRRKSTIPSLQRNFSSLKKSLRCFLADYRFLFWAFSCTCTLRSKKCLQ